MASKVLLSLVPLILATGCASPSKNLAALVTALSKDPATAYVRVVTSFGVFEMVRTNPKTNTLAHTISPDGKISVGKP